MQRFSSQISPLFFRQRKLAILFGQHSSTLLAVAIVDW
jgi:hypothetical protein